MRSKLLAFAVMLTVGGSAGADESLPNPPEAAPKKPRVAIVGDRLQLSEPIYFDVGKATVKPVSFALLDEVAATINRNAQLELVEIQVHSDERGNDKYNLRMSDQRAAAVRTYLTEHGVAAARLQARGFGETKPLCTDHNESCWSRNRRTELVIVRAR